MEFLKKMAIGEAREAIELASTYQKMELSFFMY